jgi:electron transfer flavoprotein alpha subunit
MILVLVEHDGGRPDRSSLEALTVGRSLGERLGVSMEALLIGTGASAAAASLDAYGVGRAHAAEGDRSATYAPAAWGRILARTTESSGADLVLAAGTDRGHEVVAHAAAMTDAPMAANCVEVEPGDPLRVTRQRWGGSLLEEATIAGPVRFLTLAEHVVEPTEATHPAQVIVEPTSPEIADADLRSRVVSRVPPETGRVSLADARVVVGGGRGVGSGEAFAQLEELAGLLDGAVGVSRVVTSAGWRPHAEQVGQTGTRIAPDLYIACGISGAIQHIVGCRAAKAILAINTDPEAPIMARASYAVIGDLHAVLPAISDEIRRVAGR